MKTQTKILLSASLFLWLPRTGWPADNDFVPAQFVAADTCGSNARGAACPGRIKWDPSDLYGGRLSEFDRRFSFPHELFHAVQFGYLPFRRLWCETDLTSVGPGGWLMEGMGDAMSWDWAISRKFAFRPPLGTNWRYDGRRMYNDPLHRPRNAQGYYATSSFWRHLRKKCGSYSIYRAVLADDPDQVAECPAVRGKPPEKIKPADDYEMPFWLVGPDGSISATEETGKFSYALTTAAAYYRDAGFTIPCLQSDPTLAPNYGYTLRSEAIADDQGRSDTVPQQRERLKNGHPPGIDPTDKEVLRLVDRVLSELVSRLCGSGQQSLGLGYCKTFADEGFGGLTVAYLSFINEWTEQLVTGRMQVVASSRPISQEVFRGGCKPLVDGALTLDIAEIASECVWLPRQYSALQTFHVTVSGPQQDLGQLHLGWHGCYALPQATLSVQDEAVSTKVWVLRPHAGRPGCQSDRADYTLVFSNLSRKVEATRPLRSLAVRIERVVEGEMNSGG